MQPFHIRKAVIPVAGLGTRFLPATKGMPKELIPILDVPMIQYVVEEAVNAGLTEIIFVTALGKEAVEEYFLPNPKLEKHLEAGGKKDLLAQVRRISNLCKPVSVLQGEPKGLGHAVLMAAPAVKGEAFAVLLPDDLVVGGPKPCIGQLIDVFHDQKTSVIGVMDVPREETRKYGVVGGKVLSERLMKVETMVEKPKPSEAPSTWATPGRYVLTPKTMEILARTKAGALGEIQLTDALAILAKEEGLYAYLFEGRRYDTGDRMGYLEATIAFALERPELREGFLKLLKKYGSS